MARDPAGSARFASLLVVGDSSHKIVVLTTDLLGFILEVAVLVRDGREPVGVMAMTNGILVGGHGWAGPGLLDLPSPPSGWPVGSYATYVEA